MLLVLGSCLDRLFAFALSEVGERSCPSSVRQLVTSCPPFCKVSEHFTRFYRTVAAETGASPVAVEARLRSFFDSMCWHVRMAKTEEAAKLQLHSWTMGVNLAVPRPVWALAIHNRLPLERPFSLPGRAQIAPGLGSQSWTPDVGANFPFTAGFVAASPARVGKKVSTADGMPTTPSPSDPPDVGPGEDATTSPAGPPSGQPSDPEGER